MRVSGEAVLQAAPARVYDALTDPALLARAVPGCRRLEASGDGRCQLSVTAAVASVAGTYDGEVQVTERQPPHALALHARGSGSAGTVDADVRVDLAADGDGTRLTYETDAAVGGKVGGVGQRLLRSAASRLAADLFAGVDRELTGPAVVAEPAEHAVAPAAHTGRSVADIVPWVAAVLVGAVVGWWLRSLVGAGRRGRRTVG